MARVEQTSIVPELRATIHLVLDDLGALGLICRETSLAECDEETIIENFLSGQYCKPLRVLAFDVDEAWSRDVSEDIARAILARGKRGARLGAAARAFVEQHTGVEVLAEAG